MAVDSISMLVLLSALLDGWRWRRAAQANVRLSNYVREERSADKDSIGS